MDHCCAGAGLAAAAAWVGPDPLRLGSVPAAHLLAKYVMEHYGATQRCSLEKNIFNILKNIYIKINFVLVAVFSTKQNLVSRITLFILFP